MTTKSETHCINIQCVSGFFTTEHLKRFNRLQPDVKYICPLTLFPFSPNIQFPYVPALDYGNIVYGPIWLSFLGVISCHCTVNHAVVIIFPFPSFSFILSFMLFLFSIKHRKQAIRHYGDFFSLFFIQKGLSFMYN